MFSPGYLTAAGAALLNEMARQYQANGFRIGVTSWPLTVSRPGRMQGTIIGIDPRAFGGDFFFAEILGSAAAYPSGGSGTDADDRAYSWVERVQDVAGVWRDGTRFGEFNAYAVEPEAGYTGTVAAGTIVMMRASSTVGGTWEFLPAADGGGGGVEYWYAELISGTANTAGPWSWRERVMTSAGVWADGSRGGTANAYLSLTAGGLTPSLTANRDIVLMRSSTTVPGLYEFVTVTDQSRIVVNGVWSGFASLITSSGTWSGVLTPPSPGSSFVLPTTVNGSQYLVTHNVVGIVGNSAASSISYRLVLDGTPVTNSERYVVSSPAGVTTTAGACLVCLIAPNGGAGSVQYQFKRDGAGTWTQSDVGGSQGAIQVIRLK